MMNYFTFLVVCTSLLDYEISFMFSVVSLLFVFIFKFLLFYELTITDKMRFVNKKIDKIKINIILTAKNNFIHIIN